MKEYEWQVRLEATLKETLITIEWRKEMIVGYRNV